MPKLEVQIVAGDFPTNREKSLADRQSRHPGLAEIPNS
jgi:hypothetical protein